MDIGNKIKQLRYKSGFTQEQLASKLGISSQSVSKWETSVSMPDITLLPLLAEEFGVSIDELFDLAPEQTLNRIEKRMEQEEELSGDIFKEYEEFLKMQLSEHKDDARILGLLAELYHHRMEADAKKVSKFAREAIKLQPEKKACQWLLNIAEGQYVWDWNCADHTSLIDFYKEVIREDTETPATPLPYYYLIDNLIADHRTKEAARYLSIYETLPAAKPFMVQIYKAHIALAEFNEKAADTLIEEGLAIYGADGGYLFEAAQYYARKCNYEKALTLYEQSWKTEECNKPRYTDTLYGIAKIYGILGQKDKVLQTYDRILDTLKSEWNFSEEDRVVAETVQEKLKIFNTK
jgi:transcriptional regulator with XRE-family HTH domain